MANQITHDIVREEEEPEEQAGSGSGCGTVSARSGGRATEAQSEADPSDVEVTSEPDREFVDVAGGIAPAEEVRSPVLPRHQVQTRNGERDGNQNPACD